MSVDNQTNDTGTPKDCYCVCHSPASSCAWCEHCKGDNEVGRAARERTGTQELREAIERCLPDVPSHARPYAVDKLEALIASKVEEARGQAFAGGFGAGGGEVYDLELAWKLYNEALQSKEGEM